MKRASRLLLAVLLSLGLTHGAAPAGADEEAPATAVVKRGPLGDALKVRGAVAPAAYKSVACEPEVYAGPFEVVEAMGEGPVVKGQTLLRFDEAPYREQLAARERSVAQLRIRLRKAELDARMDAEDHGVTLDDLLRKKRLADEELSRFEEVDRKLLEQEMLHQFEGRRIQIQNAREELEQLESMYKEDDLTEETEEIVLKRNRRNLERMLASFERAKVRHEHAMKVELPRRHENLRLAARRAAGALERYQASRPLDEQKRDLDLAKSREDLAEAEEDLQKLRGDGARLTLKAPFAGYAVRGVLEAGRWKSLGAAEDYEAGAKSAARRTLYTVLDESVLRVHTTIAEAHLGSVRPGLAATVRTAATGEQAFEAEIARVARYGIVPPRASSALHDVVLRLKGDHALLRAGLTCEVEIPRPDGDAVLSVPVGCLQIEDEGAFAWVLGDAGPVKTKVTTGRTVSGRIVVESGLEAGQRVLRTPPAVEKE